jgi:hypothetical protein
MSIYSSKEHDLLLYHEAINKEQDQLKKKEIEASKRLSKKDPAVYTDEERKYVDRLVILNLFQISIRCRCGNT